MRATVMHSAPGYLLVFSSAEEDFPLGYVHRAALAIELLTGNRADVQRLVTLTPCLPVSISLDEALRQLNRKQAELGILCDQQGTPLGACTRECLQQLASATSSYAAERPDKTSNTESMNRQCAEAALGEQQWNFLPWPC